MNPAVLVYLAVGVIVMVGCYLWATLGGPLDDQTQKRLIVLCSLVAACWPSVLLLAVLYQTEKGREWIRAVIFGGGPR